MKFNFDAQWLAAVTYKELLILRTCVANRVAYIKELCEDGKSETLNEYLQELIRLEDDLLNMIEIARQSPIRVLE